MRGGSQCREKLSTLLDYPDTLTAGEESYMLKNLVVHSGSDSGDVALSQEDDIVDPATNPLELSHPLPLSPTQVTA